MPSLADHQSSQITKLLYMGDSSSGKTGSLVSLVKAGYKLRIMDMDNGLDSLTAFVRRECPDKIANVEFVSLRDPISGVTSDRPIYSGGAPKAFSTAMALLNKWKTGDTDLGVPAQWGAECIFVLDSLTFFADAAYNWADSMNPGVKDKRQIFYTAQQAVENVLAMLTSVDFKTNVIVISHVKYVDNPDGTRKGYPTAIGSALSPTIPRYFNSVALCANQGGKRLVQTASTAMIDLKNPAPFKMVPALPIDNALATFFQTLRS